MTFEQLLSLSGMLFLMLVAYLLSNSRRKISLRVVLWGVALQFIFALIILRTNMGRSFFAFMNDVIVALLGFTEEGARFLFGNLVYNNVPVGEGPAGMGPFTPTVNMVANTGSFFAFNVLPTIIFFSSLMNVLYYLGIVQKIVYFFAKIMNVTMGTSGAESLSASANIFVGQTEAPLVVRPYVKDMTMSELMAVMTGGMATVAGGVMAAYVGMLQHVFPDIAGHLLSASIMSAPAALVMAKIMIPETSEPLTKGMVKVKVEKTEVNVIDAAAKGAGDGLTLALNVGAMLLAFLALIAMINYGFFLAGSGFNRITGRDSQIAYLTPPDIARVEEGDILKVNLIKHSESIEYSYVIEQVDAPKNKVHLNAPFEKSVDNETFRIFDSDGASKFNSSGLTVQKGISLTLQTILGYLLAPVAWIMGVPWRDAFEVGKLFGIKTVLNEFVAYLEFAAIIETLSHRSKVIVVYALCGFANFSSIAIQIGGIGGIAPSRRSDLAKLGIKSVIAGTLAAFMTGTIAGALIP